MAVVLVKRLALRLFARLSFCTCIWHKRNKAIAFLLDNLVVFGEHHCGAELLGLLKIHQSIRYNYHGVADCHLTCSGTVKADASAATLTLYNICLEPHHHQDAVVDWWSGSGPAPGLHYI